MESVYNVLVEVIETVCDKYCKFPEEYSRKFGGDEDKALEELCKEKCESCVLNKLI